jgi:hypothetical protein
MDTDEFLYWRNSAENFDIGGSDATDVNDGSPLGKWNLFEKVFFSSTSD